MKEVFSLTKLTTVQKIRSGEFIALQAIEIITIPHRSIIDDHASQNVDVESRYKADIQGLLTEVYQIFKGSASGYTPSDLSIELLWTTQEVQNQPFKASIRLFLISRAINRNSETACRLAEEQATLFKSLLISQKYECVGISDSSLKDAISLIDTTDTRAITKEERLDNLQNLHDRFHKAFLVHRLHYRNGNVSCQQ